MNGDLEICKIDNYFDHKKDLHNTAVVIVRESPVSMVQTNPSNTPETLQDQHNQCPASGQQNPAGGSQSRRNKSCSTTKGVSSQIPCSSIINQTKESEFVERKVTQEKTKKRVHYSKDSFDELFTD